MPGAPVAASNTSQVFARGNRLSSTSRNGPELGSLTNSTSTPRARKAATAFTLRAICSLMFCSSFSGGGSCLNSGNRSAQIPRTSARYPASVSTLLHPLDWFTANFLDTSFTLNGFTTSILNRAFFAFFVVVTLFAFRHLDPVLLTYLLVLGAIPAMMGPLTSYMRYVLVAFPLFVFLARQLGPRSVYFAIVPSATVQVLFLLAHAANLWIS